MTMKPKLLSFLTPFTFPALLHAQGELDPSSAPAPTMKTLEQVEPRTDVTTLEGDADSTHLIDEPGSYYLSGNLAFNTAHGIEITASQVSLDLMGFTITSGGGPDGDAIAITTGGLSEITIRNGHIAGPGIEVGVNGSLPNADNPRNVRVSRISISDCSAGIVVFDPLEDTQNTVDHCSVRQASVIAISAGTVSHSSVSNCSASGIVAKGDVTHSSATGCGTNGILAQGNVSHCHADQCGEVALDVSGNVSHSTGTSTGSGSDHHGIDANGNVTDSTGEAAGGDGIRANGTVSRSTGESTGGGVGINCAIAIGCTTSGGEAIADKYLMP